MEIFYFKTKLVFDNINRTLGTTNLGDIVVNVNKIYIPQDNNIQIVYDLTEDIWYTLHYNQVVNTKCFLTVIFDSYTIYDLRFFDLLTRLDRDYTADEILQLKKEHIRERRERECFPIINRGRLWYDRLPSEMYTKLNNWYQAWLDAPATLEVPEYLYEIDNKLNQVEDIL